MLLCTGFSPHLYYTVTIAYLFLYTVVDPMGDHLVQEAIDNAIVERTAIIVSHRLPTLKKVDQIVVLDSRGVIDIGTHDDLSIRCDKYQELVKQK